MFDKHQHTLIDENEEDPLFFYLISTIISFILFTTNFIIYIIYLTKISDKIEENIINKEIEINPTMKKARSHEVKKVVFEEPKKEIFSSPTPSVPLNLNVDDKEVKYIKPSISDLLINEYSKGAILFKTTNLGFEIVKQSLDFEQ